MADWFDALLCVDVGIVTQKLAQQYCWGFVCLCSFFYITKSVFTLHVEKLGCSPLLHIELGIGWFRNPLFHQTTPHPTTASAQIQTLSPQSTLNRTPSFSL